MARPMAPVGSLLALMALSAPALAAETLDERLAIVTADPLYAHAHWGMLVVDLETGETVYEQNADQLFAPASTTKLFSVAAALDALGADHRFETPLYARGERDDQGTLTGHLILVASGDLTLGGRTDEAGHIAFANSDHTYAGFSPNAELTAPDPLAGLDDLARQAAASGLKRVRGDVLVDDRLFDRAEGTGSGPSLITPILVNDNLIDLTISPGEAGGAADVAWRPQSAAWQVDARVETVAEGGESKVEVQSLGSGRFVVRGQIAAARQPLVRIVEVDDPASFARTLLIEALARQGIVVEASPLAANRPEALPPPMATASVNPESGSAGASPSQDGYAALQQIAVLTSPPFSENARLILKVSHNLHASTLPLLVAAHHGQRTLADGLHRQHDFLKAAGVDVDAISFGGAAGGDRADYVTPRVVVQLLRHMAGRPDFEAYRAALPILGVDGTLSAAAGEDSPARDRVQAKTGTLIWENTMNGRYLLTSKALAGYLTTTSGRRLVLGLYVNNVHLDDTASTARVGRDLGRLCDVFCTAE